MRQIERASVAGRSSGLMSRGLIVLKRTMPAAAVVPMADVVPATACSHSDADLEAAHGDCDEAARAGAAAATTAPAGQVSDVAVTTTVPAEYRLARAFSEIFDTDGWEVRSAGPSDEPGGRDAAGFEDRRTDLEGVAVVLSLHGSQSGVGDMPWRCGVLPPVYPST